MCVRHTQNLAMRKCSGNSGMKADDIDLCAGCASVVTVTQFGSRA